MNELDRLRQEAEALKLHIRDARKNVKDCTMESKTENLDSINRLNMRARRFDILLFNIYPSQKSVFAHSFENRS